jgi:hypothetical protein
MSEHVTPVLELRVITLRPTAEQLAAWSAAAAAGNIPIDEWLADLADAATSGGERTWPAVVALKHPVDFGTERILSLTFRRGKLGDLKGLKIEEVPPANQLLLLASRMCGTPVAALELLDADDGAEVLEIALGFFASCLAGGRKR